MPSGGAAKMPGSFAGGNASGGGRSRNRRHGRKGFTLVGGQGRVLRLDHSDLQLQLALLGLQVGAHRGGLLGGGLGIGGRFGRRFLGHRGLPADIAVALHLCRHLGGHHPLHRELIDEPLR